MKDTPLTFLKEFFEYTLAFFLILECNSLYSYTYGYSGSDVGLVFYVWIVLSALVLLLYYGRIAWEGKIPCRGLFVTLGLIYGYLIILYFGNVRPVGSSSAVTSFVRHALIFLPLMTALFFLMRKTGHAFDLFYKYADLVCIMAAISLFVFIIITFLPDNILSDFIWSRWSDLGRIRPLRNFFNVACVSGFRNFLGLTIFRNQGFFTEPLMFCIPLLTALAVEMFLRKHSRWSLLKWIILSLVIFTSQATIGMMICVLSWGLLIFRICPAKFRKIVIPAAVLLVLVGGWLLLRQKLFVTNDSSLSSFAVHLEDYRLGIKAFLSKLLFGGGYNNTRYIQTFMSEERYANNRGFSNTIAVVLGNSGIIGGLFYLLPFGICLWQFRKKENRGIGYWMIVLFAMYCTIIFYHRYYPFLIYAFGFSLAEFQVSRGKKWTFTILPQMDSLMAPVKKLQIGFSGEQEAGETTETNKFRLLPDRKIIAILAALIAAALFFSRPLFSGLYAFFMTHQLMLGQALWKCTCLCLMGLFLALYVLRRWKCVKSINNKVIFTAALAAFHICYLWLYPVLYTRINTLLQLRNEPADAKESFLLFILYLLPFGLCELFLLLRRTLSRKRYLAVLLCVCGILAAGGAAVWHTGRRAINPQASTRLSDIQLTLQSITESAQGPVYANDLGGLFHAADADISATTAKDRGFSVLPLVSAVFPHDSDQRELFSNGFEMTELSGDWILYSNDEEVIHYLQGEGYAFDRYYPFERELDLKRERKRNKLEKARKGSLIVEGEEHSLAKTARYLLEPGNYTVTYNLHMDLSQLEGEDVVCHPSITYNKGENIAVYRDVSSAQFDEEGNLTLEIPVTAGLWENVEFLLYGEKDYRIRVKRISWKQTPDYITVRKTNGRDQAVREEYFQLNGEPYLNADGVCALEREYNGVGQVSCIRYLDENGQPVMTRSKYAEIHYKYNKKGLKEEETYYGLDGRPCLQGNWSAGTLYDYDASWNVCETRSFGLDREPVINSGGYSRVSRSFNEKNQQIREDYYNTEDRLCLLSGGYASCCYEYDEDGNNTVISYYGLDGEPVLTTSGYAQIRRTFNPQKQIIREEYFGTDGNPIQISRGFAAQEREYDDYGNVSVYRHFGKDGNPIIMNDGYAEVRRVYNEKRQIIRESFYGADGERMELPGGYSAAAYAYDPAGNTVVYCYYDNQDQPVITSSGYAELHRTYDERHYVIHEEYYGTDGNLISLFEGQYMADFSCDEAGNAVETRYYDANRAPVMTLSGYAEVHRAFNDRKQVIQERYYDTEGNPVVNIYGYAGWDREMNEFGSVNWQKYYGVRGENTLINDGYHEVRREFDPEGKLLAESYFDTEGNPIVRNTGYAVMKRSYTDDNDIKEDLFLDADGNPASIGPGYTSVQYNYNEDHQLTLVYYLDAEGNIVPAGSGYFHEYLRDLIEKRRESDSLTVFISVKDEAVNSLTVTLYQDLKDLGIQTDLRGHIRNSFYAIIGKDEEKEDISYGGLLTTDGVLPDGTSYEVTSAGYQVGNYSSVIIDGQEYAKNVRGMNFVVYDSSLHQVTDSVAFDTYIQEMTVTR